MIRIRHLKDEAELIFILEGSLSYMAHEVESDSSITIKTRCRREYRDPKDEVCICMGSKGDKGEVSPSGSTHVLVLCPVFYQQRK